MRAIDDCIGSTYSKFIYLLSHTRKDFATSSLQGEVARENEEDNDGGGDLKQYEIDRRRRWEQRYVNTTAAMQQDWFPSFLSLDPLPPCSSHPYIFFNQDQTSITFVGFRVTQDGDLIDPAHGGILEQAIVTKQLCAGLKQNGVNFDDDYQKWTKDTMIEKVGTVMGLEYICDPDPSYVFTVDNLIKMLAIQMRFRYVYGHACVCMGCIHICVCVLSVYVY